jgi:hypothetical protein
MIIPEINGGPFFDAIVRVILEVKPDLLIEVGASNGMGSTSAIMQGRGRNEKGEIHCVEVDHGRCEEFREHHVNHEFVHLHEGCSVSLEDYMSAVTVRDLYESNPQFNCCAEPLDKILSWRRSEMNDISLKGIKQNTLKECVSELFMPSTFVLLDGSAFTGLAEVEKMWGSKVIALDDTVDIKHFHSRKRLDASSFYHIYDKNDNDRNGWAIYVRS